jgi:hypothetical protein
MNMKHERPQRTVEAHAPAIGFLSTLLAVVLGTRILCMLSFRSVAEQIPRPLSISINT